MQTSCRLTPSRPPPQHRALGGYRQAGRFTGLPLSAPAHALADPWVSLVSGLGSCVVGALPDRCVSRDATNVGKTPASRSLLRRALCRPVRLPGRLCHVGVGTTRLADPKLRPDPLSGEAVDRPLPAHFGSLPVVLIAAVRLGFTTLAVCGSVGRAVAHRPQVVDNDTIPMNEFLVSLCVSIRTR